MSQFFISYARKDKAFVLDLRRKLKSSGHRAWIDTFSITAGADWLEAIDSAIRSSDAVLVVFSKNSINSPYVNYEWAYALGAGIKVLPLVLQSKLKLHMRLFTTNHVNVSERNTRRMGDIAKALGELEKAPRPKFPTGRVRKGIPHLAAKFEMDGNGRPIWNSDIDAYEMTLSIKGAPAETQKVLFEILDESYSDPIWTNSRPEKAFSEEMTSYGDIMISAEGKTRSNSVLWSIEESLYDALLRGHSGVRSASLIKALKEIKNN
jgi:hypothetical protein